MRSEIIRSVAQGAGAFGATGCNTLRGFFGLTNSGGLSVSAPERYAMDLLKKFRLGHLDLDAPLASAITRDDRDHDGSSQKSSTNSRNGMNRGGSDEGDNLSSGERQLVSLVQGLLGPSVGDGSRCASAQVYLFDEITASVDYAADEAVNEVILSLPATVIAIMHRLHHLPKFDQVE